jgi:hypothetical protein
MHEGLRLVLVLLTAAVLAVGIVRALRLPSLLAYLAIGVAVGPHALGWLHESESTERLAEFGVVFLMFSIGLEFSLPRLVAMRWQVFGLGGAQVVVTIAGDDGHRPFRRYPLAGQPGARRGVRHVVDGHRRPPAGGEARPALGLGAAHHERAAVPGPRRGVRC